MMKQIFLTSSALLLLSACAQTEPVDETALDNVDPPVLTFEEDSGSEPQPDAAMRWEIDEPANAALYGADRANTLLSVRCDEESDQLIVSRFSRTVPSGAGTLTVSGNGAVASLPVVAEPNDAGPGGRLSATLDEGDIASSLAEAFRGEGTINVSVTGAEPIVLNSGAEVRMILDACLGAADQTASPADTDADIPSANAVDLDPAT